MITIEKYNYFDEILISYWKILEQNNPYIFIYQRFSWNKYWAQIFEANYFFEILVVLNFSKPVVILPFCVNRVGIVKKIEFIGLDQSDYLSPIIDKDFIFTYEIWHQLKNSITLKYDIMILKNIPNFFNNNQVNQFIYINKCQFQSLAFSLKLPNSFDLFEKSLKSSFRSDNRRNLRRLEETGIVSFINLDNNLDQNFKEISIALEQKSRRIKNHLGKSMLQNDLVNKFYNNSYKIHDENYKIIFSYLLYNDNHLLATHWGIIDNTRFYYILPTIEGREWYKFSCGKLLINNLIQYSISKNLSVFDFTIGDENYKKDWCNETNTIYKLIETKSIIGYFYNLKLIIISYVKNNQTLKFYWRRIKKRLINKSKLS
jgi:CelD/BcsL family acetyltransferase involved in cellulose biosynthesis